MSDLQSSSSIPQDLWTQVGRGQAFGLVANGCYAAQARCLKQIRETESYKGENLTWREFCSRYASISDRQADRLIERLEEFGETYFRLSEVMKISPETYRRLATAGVLKDDSIDIGGELVPIAPENAPRIKAAIAALRHDLDLARQRKVHQTFPDLPLLREQLASYTATLAHIAAHSQNKKERDCIINLIRDSIGALQEQWHRAQSIE